jgi:hypothetical protein
MVQCQVYIASDGRSADELRTRKDLEGNGRDLIEITVPSSEDFMGSC